jgi:hypothetical protein
VARTGGEGEVWAATSCLGQVRYQLVVYGERRKQVAPGEAEATASRQEVRGMLTPLNGNRWALLAALEREGELSLHLDDGRRLPFDLAADFGRGLQIQGRGDFECGAAKSAARQSG